MLRDLNDDQALLTRFHHLELVTDASDRAMLLLDDQHRIIYANPAFTELSGYEPSEVVGLVPSEFLASPNMDQDALNEARSQATQADGFQREILTRDRWGRERWFLTTVNPVLDDNGGLRHIVLIAADITQSKQLERFQLDAQEALASEVPLRDFGDFLCRRVEALAPEVVPSILLVDHDSRLRAMAAPGLPRHYTAAIDGLPVGEGQGSCGTAAFRGEPVVVTDIATDPLWAPFLDSGLPEELKACWSSPIKRRDGLVLGAFAFYYREQRGPGAWHQRIIDACLHLCMIAIERHETKAQIAQLAHFDPLTGLPNRTRFFQDVAERLHYHADSNVACVFLDMDRFKDVNETLGHAAGDQLLVETARRLQQQFYAEGTVYRLGGDEFLVLLPDCNAARASSIAERAMRVLADPADIAGVQLAVTPSIGISLFPGDGTDGDTLLQHAASALSQAKAARRGSYRFFSPDMDKAAQDRLRLGTALREAIAKDALELHYQPQVKAEGGGLHGVEALARWRHPELGPVSPDRFIPLAEETGQIETIDRWALRLACRQMAAWRSNGVQVPAVSVNLSALSFRQRDMPAFVTGLLREHQLEPQRLTIEVTESVMMDSHTDTLDTVREVRKLGVGLSLDDFGTGFSSLSRLALLPITELKIDRSFMRDFGVDRGALALVTAVVRIGQSLGLTVVSEGVETEEQRGLLRGLGCGVMQGYLFAKPLPTQELLSWVGARA